MKSILAAALVLGLCGSACVAEAADPVGTWKCDYTVGGQARTVTLTIKKEGDGVAGTLNWPDQKDEPIKDPKFADGKLTFSAVRKFMDRVIPLDYSLTIDGDKLTGKGTSTSGGQKTEFEMTGTREK
jgi:opacity protein-like surface antigen